jgi:hypothetical protein
MTSNKGNFDDWVLTAFAIVILWGIPGCGGSAGPKTHAVNGQVQLAGGDVKDLAGHSLEAALGTDLTVRASGQIQEDGSFSLETLQAGVLHSGAVEGAYRVRIVLSDDDPEARRRAAQALHPRFLQFDSSGLSIQVPNNDPVTVVLSRQ